MNIECLVLHPFTDSQIVECIAWRVGPGRLYRGGINDLLALQHLHPTKFLLRASTNIPRIARSKPRYQATASHSTPSSESFISTWGGQYITLNPSLIIQRNAYTQRHPHPPHPHTHLPTLLTYSTNIRSSLPLPPNPPLLFRRHILWVSRCSM